MNKEICKRCGNKLTLMSYFQLDDEGNNVGLRYYGTCRNNERYPVIDYEFSEIESEMIYNLNKEIEYIYELPFFDEMEIRKDCPYYIEHKIKEWNDEFGDM